MSLIDDFFYLIFPKTREEEDEKAIDNSPWVRVAIIAFIALMALVLALVGYLLFEGPQICYCGYTRAGTANTIMNFFLK